MLYAQPSMCPGKYDAQYSWDFEIKNELSNLGQTTRFRDNQKKKENLSNTVFCRSGWPQGKIEKKSK